jgi:hypothetical protein
MLSDFPVTTWSDPLAGDVFWRAIGTFTRPAALVIRAVNAHVCAPLEGPPEAGCMPRRPLTSYAAALSSGDFSLVKVFSATIIIWRLIAFNDSKCHGHSNFRASNGISESLRILSGVG